MGPENALLAAMLLHVRIPGVDMTVHCTLSASAGADPTQFVHTQTAASKLPQLPAAEEAQSQLNYKLNRSVNSTEGRKERKKY